MRPTVPGVARQAVEKQGPALLKKGEEGIPIRKDGLQRPGSEGAALPEQMSQPIVQEARQPLPSVVPPQQEAQQIGWAPDELGREVEDVPKHEVPGRVLAEPVRSVAFLCPAERVEVAPVERCDDRVAESGKQIVQAEGKPPTGLHQIVGKRRPIVPLGAHDDFEAGALVPVPARPEPRFVVEAEFDVILEGDDLETSPADSFEEGGFKQQAIGIGRQGQARNPRREFLQDTVAPVRHGTGTRSLRDARQREARPVSVPRGDVEHPAVRDDRSLPLSG